MRRHLYLITSHPEDEFVGRVESREKAYMMGEKNSENTVDKRNLDTGDGYSMCIVGLGYHDFESETAYENPMRFKEVVQKKLGEIDAEHLDKAGVELEAAAGTAPEAEQNGGENVE